MRRRVGVCLGVVAVVGLAACGNDSPTAVGQPLVPGSLVRTFEVVLDGSQFLTGDTTVSGFVTPGQAATLVVANQYAGALDAHGLASFSVPPISVTFTDSLGASHLDTIPHFIGARLVFHVDSAAVGSGPTQLAVNLADEDWDALSANWQNRVDTTGDRIPWTQPGGTMGAQVDTVTWTGQPDSLVAELDSQTVELLKDSTTAARGIVVSIPMPSSGTRFQAHSVSLFYQSIPSVRPDTVIETAATTARVAFLYQPEAPPPGTDLRVAGLPTWHTILEFRDRMDTLNLPCPGEPGCEIPVAKAAVTAADLLIQPLAAPPGYIPELPFSVDPRPVLRSPLIPLARSPLAAEITASPPTVAPAAFATGGGARVAVPIESFITTLLTPPTDSTSSSGPTLTMALLSLAPTDIFGIGTFGSLATGDAAPQLRLVLTIAQKDLIR
jgi:hypothetical protein